MMPAHKRTEVQLDNPVEYYQWVPFFLTFQLISFIAPGLFWKWARKRQSLDLDTILERVDGIRDAVDDEKDREGKISDLVEYLYETLTPSSNWTYSNLSLTLIFLSMKMWTLINVIYQFICLLYFVEDGGVSIGVEMITSFLNGKLTSRFFPLEVLCDVTIYKLANKQKYTMQCYLSLNYFHDKMFAVLWMWYIFLIIYTTVSLLYFCFSLLPVETFVRPFFSPSLYEDNRKRIKDFYNNMLFTDGIVVLKFISKLKGHRMSIEIAERLYHKFEKTEESSAWIYPHSLKMKNRPKVIDEY